MLAESRCISKLCAFRNQVLSESRCFRNAGAFGKPLFAESRCVWKAGARGKKVLSKSRCLLRQVKLTAAPFECDANAATFLSKYFHCSRESEVCDAAVSASLFSQVLRSAILCSFQLQKIRRVCERSIDLSLAKEKASRAQVLAECESQIGKLNKCV